MSGQTKIVGSVILPAYNEAEALPEVLGALEKLVGDDCEIIVIDDGSKDDTARVASEWNCRLIRHPRNMGKGAAMRTGIANARGERIVIMDADATYPAEAVPRMIDMLANHDLVRCRRVSRATHMSFINRAGNWIFDLLLTLVHGLEGSDHLSGLYGLRREVLLQMNLEADGFDIEAEIGIKARVRRLRVATFPIPYHARVGEKKLRPWRDGVLILRRILLLVLVFNPMATFVLPGLILLLLSACVAVMLSRGPVQTPYFGLSIHSYIVATLGTLAAFQLIAFGMAAALYAIAAGYRPQRWLIALSSRIVRLGSAAIGVLLVAGAGANVVRLIIKWFMEGAGYFSETRAIVMSSTLAVWGLQIVSAALFLSIFSDKLRASQQQDAGESVHEQRPPNSGPGA